MKMSKRIVVGLVMIFGLALLVGNIIQYSVCVDLQRDNDNWRTHCDDLRDTIDTYEQEIEAQANSIKELQKDLKWETYLYEETNADYQNVLDATLQYYKERAKEEGFEPDQQDWLYGGSGKWYFYIYDDESNEEDVKVSELSVEQ